MTSFRKMGLPPACFHVFLQRLFSPLFDNPCLGCGMAGADPLCQACQCAMSNPLTDACERCQGSLQGACCLLCRQPDVPFERVFALGAYAGGLRNLIRRMKYHSRADLGYWLGGRLALLLAPHVKEDWRVVPVPIHPARRRERGYNQTEPMAYQIAKHLGLAYDAQWLRRCFQSRPSYLQGREDRWSQAAGVFEVAPSAERGCSILLVDDILTSGATAWEASWALRRAGARSVHLVVAARAGTQAPSS